MNCSLRIIGTAAILFALLSPSPLFADAIADIFIAADHTAADAFGDIPESVFQDVRDNLTVFYGHTSHGSQLITGMEMIRNENPGGLGCYDPPNISEYGDDLGNDDWDAVTTNYLQDNPSTNVVLWSWCGQLSWYTGEEVNRYLQKMDGLEQQYPGVTFVYMTGHLDGEGPGGAIYNNNDAIRAFCRDNNKILFDFADIESYDPDGVYYPYESDWCYWCETWCSDHSCPDSCIDDSDCQHSVCFNCYRKGKAFWWLLGRVAGWDGETSS